MLRSRSRRGFTLIELLVAVGIMLILAGLAVGVISVALQGDRIPSGARQVQSFLEGARDRAIFAKETRGVRFYLDERTFPVPVISSMAYIGSPGVDTGTDGASETNPYTVQVQPPSGGVYYVELVPPAMPFVEPVPKKWTRLAALQVLRPGLRIKIPDDSTGSWYPISDRSFQRFGPDDAPGVAGVDDDGDTNIDTFMMTGEWDYKELGWAMSDDVGAEFDLDVNGAYQLTNDGSQMGVPVRLFVGRPFPVALQGTNQSYRLELGVTVLADEDVVQLPTNVLIDVASAGSNVPLEWQTYNYRQMDILFSAQGAVTGTAATKGLIHFPIVDARDITNGFSLGQLTNSNLPRQGDEVIVSLFTRTGNIETSPVDTTDVAPADGVADDPFLYAETGATE